MKKIFWIAGALSALLLSVTLTGCGGGGGGGDEKSSSESTAVSTTSPAPSTVSSSLYQMQLLGTLGEESYAIAISESGQVLGNYLTAGGAQHIFRWTEGTMKHLVDSAQAMDLNDAGDVVGWLFTDTGTEAFVYTDQVYLFDLPEGPSRAYALDSRGRVAGRHTGEMEQSFLDEEGSPLFLAPDLNAYAVEMNDAGQVLIKELRQNGFHTLLAQTDGSMVDLGTLGGASTQGTDINESGQVVGWSQTADGRYQAFSWENGSMTALAEPEWTYSSAVALNDAGDILIKASVGTEKTIFLLKDGELIDLELGGGYVEVSDMNNSGQIVGWTETAGRFQAFLAIPL
jgi:probable HAF family extracellular repeat protein